ncbi:unnamed protein product [Cylicostephanus goldi]|uniref:Uncharacterized protein n=1 Tax=Cylicostephanus goldi TaxID=71465 RepID=A0A3P6R252_CYLGO|nr:unnamed protein product [Cylicostephanus goldi]
MMPSQDFKKTQEKAIEMEHMRLEHVRDMTAFFDMEKDRHRSLRDPMQRMRLTEKKPHSVNGNDKECALDCPTKEQVKLKTKLEDWYQTH